MFKQAVWVLKWEKKIKSKLRDTTIYYSIINSMNLHFKKLVIQTIELSHISVRNFSNQWRLIKPVSASSLALNFVFFTLFIRISRTVLWFDKSNTQMSVWKHNDFDRACFYLELHFNPLHFTLLTNFLIKSKLIECMA